MIYVKNNKLTIEGVTLDLPESFQVCTDKSEPFCDRLAFSSQDNATYIELGVEKAYASPKLALTQLPSDEFAVVNGPIKVCGNGLPDGFAVHVCRKDGGERYFELRRLLRGTEEENVQLYVVIGERKTSEPFRGDCEDLLARPEIRAFLNGIRAAV